MNQDPKNQNDDQAPRVVQVTCVPLTVLVSGFMNALPAFEWILNAVKFLVIGYAAYCILGRILFTALIVTPLLVVFVSSMFSAWEMMNYVDDDEDDEDDDGGFGDHWNNNLK